MIEYLTGYCMRVNSSGVTLMCQDVGYKVEMPLSQLCRMRVDMSQKISLWIFTHTRENGTRLFGFNHSFEKDVFEILLGLNGVGPRIALAILSTLSFEAICNAVRLEKPEVFETVPGVGKRSAEKILVELKSKIQKLLHIEDPQVADLQLQPDASKSGASFDEGSEVFADVESALLNFGYKTKHIQPIMKKLRTQEFDTLDFQVIMRSALAEITT